jgi:SAM-dependent methyltransferase
MDSTKTAYLGIIQHYEQCLQRHGDNHKGVDWPNREDAMVRYQVMLDIVPNDKDQGFRVLDFGCGLSHLYEYLQMISKPHISYAGLDLSAQFIERAKKKFPHIDYYCLDILENPQTLPEFDYILLNGVLTEKCALTYDQMLSYSLRLLQAVYAKAKRGIAFNVMSTHVDWQREDLFHLPFDTMADFLVNTLNADFIFRKDYGLFEYTTYIYKGQSRWPR